MYIFKKTFVKVAKLAFVPSYFYYDVFVFLLGECRLWQRVPTLTRSYGQHESELLQYAELYSQTISFAPLMLGVLCGFFGVFLWS